MRFFVSVLVGLFLMVGIFGHSFAAEPNNLQKSELKGLIADLNNAASNKNMALIVDNMPEHLFKQMAIRLRATEQALRENFSQQMQKQFGNLPADAYQLDAEHIEYKETNKGRFYALVPTKLDTEDSLVEYYTLALYENTKWHLVYGGQKTVQNSVFLEIYPDFEFVNMPLPKVTNKTNSTNE